MLRVVGRNVGLAGRRILLILTGTRSTLLLMILLEVPHYFCGTQSVQPS
ncbi:hypothetical protein CASFOL_026226 [Castilleja foliolosa]|uniref:Uncharacterized protein n=1 Tax=Castilleja foliolosa TaxID=1961234 RepID=A0ABD3CL20_9LAMI